MILMIVWSRSSNRSNPFWIKRSALTEFLKDDNKAILDKRQDQNREGFEELK